MRSGCGPPWRQGCGCEVGDAEIERHVGPKSLSWQAVVRVYLETFCRRNPIRLYHSAKGRIESSRAYRWVQKSDRSLRRQQTDGFGHDMLRQCGRRCKLAQAIPLGLAFLAVEMLLKR